jgi:hypothetical protein
MTRKPTFSSAPRADVTGLGAREPRAEELALAKSVESGNLDLTKAVIGCRIN